MPLPLREKRALGRESPPPPFRPPSSPQTEPILYPASSEFVRSRRRPRFEAATDWGGGGRAQREGCCSATPKNLFRWRSGGRREEGSSDRKGVRRRRPRLPPPRLPGSTQEKRERIATKGAPLSPEKGEGKSLSFPPLDSPLPFSLLLSSSRNKAEREGGGTRGAPPSFPLLLYSMTSRFIALPSSSSNYRSCSSLSVCLLRAFPWELQQYATQLSDCAYSLHVVLYMCGVLSFQGDEDTLSELFLKKQDLPFSCWFRRTAANFSYHREESQRSPFSERRSSLPPFPPFA